MEQFLQVKKCKANNFTIQTASIQIQSELSLTNSQFGLLGSIVYAGIVAIGSVSGPMFMRYNPKIILQVSLIILMVSLGLFTVNMDYQECYFIMRFLTGAAQAPLLIYFPIWVDHYGGDNKTIWLTGLQSGVPMGIFTGYVMSSFISLNLEWQWNFYIQIIMLCPPLIGFILIKNKDLDIKDQKNDVCQDYSQQSFFELCRLLIQSRVIYLYILNNIQINMDEAHQFLFTLLFQKIIINLIFSFNILLFYDYPPPPPPPSIIYIYNKQIYIYVMFSLCVCYFVVTGVQFWISNYIVTQLMQPVALVNTVFAVVSITAPTLGCVVGGTTVQRLGGYESNNALPLCFVCSLIGTFMGIFLPFVTNFWLLIALIWLFLFFGGCQVPVLTGIMISSVPKGLKAFANSSATTCMNLFGYLPAPLIYGMFADHLNKHFGILFLMMIPFVGLVLQILALRSNQVTEVDRIRMIGFYQSVSEQYQHTNIAKQEQDIAND